MYELFALEREPNSELLIRAKVEHVFGSWVNEMGGKLLRSIGIKRARANLGLRNLAYNLKLYVYLKTRKA